MARDEVIYAIRYRLEHPESIPGKSWYTVYREDIKTLLEEIENERREAARKSERRTFKGSV